MPRFQKRVSCDVGYPDGQIFISALDFQNPATGGISGLTFTQTNTTPFTEYATVPASIAAGTMHFPLSGMIYRIGLQDDLQEQFGSLAAGGANGLAVNVPITWTTTSLTAGTNVTVAVLNSAGYSAGSYVTIDILGTPETVLITSVPNGTSIIVNKLALSHSTNAQVGQNGFTTPAGVSGAPPYTGITQLTSVTAPRPKGIAITSVSLISQVVTTAATSQALALYRTVFNNGAAPVSTAIPMTGTLVNTAATSPTITTFIVNTPAYQVNPFEELVVVYTPVTPSGSTINVYGLNIGVTYNYC
jgi:hypothetical protein